ncbi:hypothetical protein PPSIR1_21274 [Plesiocystis pacifica SIR-1]|uniref:Uncharacterized protein n=1 Tax=Plesiocystis pacifica SIR-1 TaxID=391625 RepID=A6G3J4_9BACT|nr:hypothetical protein PPSIR1_21274 [Plesiocystis pacifica SIR-1]
MVPFGRYVSRSKDEPGDNQVLVGRDGQRAHFRDLLLNHGPRGAFLVTGQRGAGKTSFVHETLREYDADVFSRALRSEVGRSIFWDRVMFMLVGALGLVLLLLAHEVFNILLFLEESWYMPQDERVRSLVWFAIAPFLIVCASPVLYCWKLTQATTMKRWQAAGLTVAFVLIAVGLTLPVEVAHFLGRKEGALSNLGQLNFSPHVTAARMFLATTVFAVVSQSFSAVQRDSKVPKSHGFLSPNRSPRLRRTTVLATALAVLAPLSFELSLMTMCGLDTQACEPIAYYGNLSLGFHALALFWLMREWSLLSKGEPKHRAILPSIFAFFVSAVLFFTGTMDYAGAEAGFSPWAVYGGAVVLSSLGLAVALALAPLEVVGENHRTMFAARPRSALVLKAAAMVLVSVQLLSPLVQILLVGQAKVEIDATHWPLALLPLLFFLFTLEYEWIVRPFAWLRDDRARDLSRGLDAVSGYTPAEQDAYYTAEQHAHRVLARQTFHWWLYHSWLRTLTIHVNLGFDTLEHQHVVHAMLAGLRVAFHRRFVAWASPVAMLFVVVKVLLILVLSTLIGDRLFAPPAPVVDIHGAQQWTVERKRAQEGNAREPSALKQRLDDDAALQTRKVEALRDSLEAWFGQAFSCQGEGSDLLASRAMEARAECSLRALEEWEVQRRALEARSDIDRGGARASLGASKLGPAQGYLVDAQVEYTMSYAMAEAGCLYFPDGVADHSLIRPLARYPTLMTWVYQPLVGGRFDLPAHGGPERCTELEEQLGPTLRAEVEEALAQEASTAIVDPVYRSDLALCEFLPCVKPLPIPRREPSSGNLRGQAAWNDAVQVWRGRVPISHEGVTVRLYHLLTFLVLYLIVRLIERQYSITPYSPLLKRLDEVLDSIAGRRGVSAHSSRMTLRGSLGSLTTPHVVESKEFEKSDPRTIEIALMQILEEMRAPRLPFISRRQLSLPAPEITFVFDELDKLGARGDPERDEAELSPEDLAARGAEDMRTRKINGLFADMKNLLSGAPARFIMVGGRNLHDEWLADLTARVPLLTNIFRASIYLPSLLTDNPEPDKARWSRRIGQYVDKQHERARSNYRSWRDDYTRLSIAMQRRPEFSLGFVQPRIEAPRGSAAVQEEHKASLSFVECVPGAPEMATLWSRCMQEDFVDFLTFRSMGNPKKLKELLESFVRPTGRVARSEALRWSSKLGESDHVLLFSEDERFRVQFVATVCRRLAANFELRYAQRDDKLVLALFYFSDFLFKFHQRAFTWTNLERVDELVHVHRAPDHRKLLEELVLSWSERMLHPILNGLYAYRFRSDVTREIVYISRRSKEEMAAFNFTLDESQALKSMYKRTILAMGDDAPHDVLAGLGELFEFDQEFDSARYYYGMALAKLDGQFRGRMGHGTRNPVRDVILSSFSEGEAKDSAGQNIAWGVTRLRLMLQVGLTFELSRNYERAASEYRDARSFARTLLATYLDSEWPNFEPWSDDKVARPKGAKSLEQVRLHSLKHLNILYQGAYAEAWIAEKMSGGVDTSTSLVEEELYHLRLVLPFVGSTSTEGPKTPDPVNVRHSNFSLIMAELHNKAGDLYFFKGRQIPQAADLKKQLPTGAQATGEALTILKLRGGAEGYLLRAYYHYALGLHDLRRFIHTRLASSGPKYNVWSPKKPGEPLASTIEFRGWSDFMFRVAGSGLADLAESALSRVSLFGLIEGILTGERRRRSSAPRPEIIDFNAIAKSFNVSLIMWFEDDGRDAFPKKKEDKIAYSEWQAVSAPLLPVLDGDDIGTLSGWFGLLRLGASESEPESEPKPDESLSPGSRWLEFKERHTDAQRLLLSLLMSVSSAKLLRRAGYFEDAARELLQVADSVSHYYWWANGIRSVDKFNKKWLMLVDVNKLEKGFGFWSCLLDLGLFGLCQALDYLERGAPWKPRSVEVANVEYGVGNHVPVDLVYIACSLGLGAKWERWDSSRRRRDLLARLLERTGALGLLDDARAGSDAGRSKELVCTGTQSQFRETLRSVVEETLRMHSFPVLARLRGIKLLIDDILIRPGVATGSLDAAQLARARSLSEELWRVNDQVQAPMHFTPMHLGTTLAQLWIKCRKKAHRDSMDPLELEALKRRALRCLVQSQEVISMRRAYYETISELYYLYDDFNDRQVHYNHALQMAGCEYVALMREMLRTAENELLVMISAGRASRRPRRVRRPRRPWRVRRAQRPRRRGLTRRPRCRRGWRRRGSRPPLAS